MRYVKLVALCAMGACWLYYGLGSPVALNIGMVALLLCIK